MLVTLRGTVLGFSKGWKDGKFSPFKKILIGFPDDPDIPQLWCTVFGKSNWGFRDNSSGQLEELRLRRGLIISITGHLEFGEGRRLSVKTSGSKYGGFSVIGEYRKYFVVKVTSDQWECDERGHWRFKVDRETIVFSGEHVPPLPLIEVVPGAGVHRREIFPDSGTSVVVEGDPILISMDPPTWFFDSKSHLLVLATEKS
jgi:hypothetical protein